ncbi:glycosyltransferase [Pseudomonadales bacterium]|nr:glycosyltransferase [Pseudomonadales bacterium]
MLVTTVPQTFITILKSQPKRLNAHFEVVVVSSNPEIIKYAVSLGIQSAVVPMRRHISPIFDVYSLIQMIRIIVKHRPDIIHSFTPKAGLIASVAARLCSVAVRLHTFTGLIFPTKNGVLKGILKLTDRFICSNCSLVIAEGRGVQSQLYASNVTQSAIVLGNGNIAGIDEKFYCLESLRAVDVPLNRWHDNNTSLFNNKTIFLFIGRINEDKGIEDLFKALAHLESQTYLCLIVGDYDCSLSYQHHLEDTYIMRNDSIKLLGFMEDIRPVLKVCDCVVLPSYREGFPNVLLQAGALSRACIVTDVPGSNEIIIHDKNGYIVPVGDPIILGETMKKFCRLALVEKIALERRARENIVSKFGRNSYESRLIDFYMELFSERNV